MKCLRKGDKKRCSGPMLMIQTCFAHPLLLCAPRTINEAEIGVHSPARERSDWFEGCGRLSQAMQKKKDRERVEVSGNKKKIEQGMLSLYGCSPVSGVDAGIGCLGRRGNKKSGSEGEDRLQMPIGKSMFASARHSGNGIGSRSRPGARDAADSADKPLKGPAWRTRCGALGQCILAPGCQLARVPPTDSSSRKIMRGKDWLPVVGLCRCVYVCLAPWSLFVFFINFIALSCCI